MAKDLPDLLAELGKNGNGVSFQAGTIAYSDDAWRVYRGGVEQTSVVWLESASPRVGSCLLAIDTPTGQGQSTVYVLGATFNEPHRLQDICTIQTNGAFGRCTILLDNGIEYEEARYMSHYVPATADRAFVIWRGGEAYVTGKFPNGHAVLTIPKPPPMPDLPRSVAYGSSQFPTLQSAVWDSSAGNWSAAKTRDMRLTTTAYGVWTYGNATSTLDAKAEIVSGTITFGKRAQFGSMAEAVTVQLWRAGDIELGATEPSLLDGPFSVVVPKNYKGDQINLPVTLLDALGSGGSLVMKVPSDVTFIDGPANGYINIKWRNL